MSATFSPAVATAAVALLADQKYAPNRKHAAELAKTAPRGNRGKIADAIYAIAQLRLDRAALKPTGRTIRELLRASYAKRIGKLIRTHGPVPAKSGAGDLTETVVLDAGRREPHTSTITGQGDRSSVANSYGYAIIDHHVTHHLPADSVVRVVGGLVTVLHYRDRNNVVAGCWWAVKGRGYSCNWQHGYLIRGHHAKAKSLEAAVKAERKARKAAHLAYWESRRRESLKSMPLTHRWLTYADSLASGNCPAGTRRAAERLAESLGIPAGDLELGVAVRADVVAERLTDLAPFVGRALNAAAH
jgi:hypothetical protein